MICKLISCSKLAPWTYPDGMVNGNYQQILNWNLFSFFPVSDITAGKPKTIVVTLHETYWSVGVILLPVVAGLFHSWSFMYVAISMPTLILIFLYRWVTLLIKL